MNNRHTIALSIRPKHGFLWRYMEEHNFSVKEMAKRIGITVSTFSKMLHFQWIPNDNYPQARKTAEKLCAFFQCELEDIFSQELTEALKNHKEVAWILQNKQTLYKPEIELEFLEDYSQFQALPSPDNTARFEDKQLLDKLLDSNTLTTRESRLIRQRFLEGMSYSEIAKIEGVTGTRIKQLVVRILRKLKDHAAATGLMSEFD